MEPISTATKTQSITNTKLAIATLALLLAGGLAFGLAPLQGDRGYGYGYQNVQKCGIDTMNLLKSCKKKGTYAAMKVTCHDGSKKTLTSGYCKTSSSWAKYAEKFCKNKCTPTVTETAASSLTITKNHTQPSPRLMIAGTDVTLAGFVLTAAASGENVEMESINLNQIASWYTSSSFRNYDELWFEDEDGNEINGTRMTPINDSPVVRFSNNALIINSGTSKTIQLKARLANIGVGYNGTSGHRLGYTISRAGLVEAKGETTGNDTEITLDTGGEQPVGNFHYLYKAYPMFAKDSLSDTVLTNGVNDLYKFTITAVGDDISLYGLTFEVTAKNANVSDLYLYEVGSMETQINDTAGTLRSNIWETRGSDWTNNYYGQEIIVPVYQPRTFVLRAMVTGVEMDGFITTKIDGDRPAPSSGIALSTAADLENETHNDFIWSDMNDPVHSVDTYDWTNGYLVPSLPPSAGAAQTIAY